ncbi:MAG: hypothetical protein HY909_13975 [Deltaproteobacteria bacterium]|nr:hypothetical protein [Deltaproteobacteria bacterium]
MRAPRALPWALALMLPWALQAQPRARRPAPALRLLATHGASARGARAALGRVEPRALVCLREARQEDPVALSRLGPSLLVTLFLGGRGRPVQVALEPSSTPRGLSECLGRAFLTWDQGGHPGPTARVELRLSLVLPPGS